MTARFTVYADCVDIRPDVDVSDEARKGIAKLGERLRSFVTAVTENKTLDDCRDDLHRGEEMMGSLYRQYFKGRPKESGISYLMLVRDQSAGTVLPLTVRVSLATKACFWDFAGRWRATTVVPRLSFREDMYRCVSDIFPPAGWVHRNAKYITTIPGHLPYNMTRVSRGDIPTPEQLLDGSFWKKKGHIHVLGIEGSMEAYVRKNEDGSLEMFSTFDPTQDLLGDTGVGIYRIEIGMRRLRLSTVLKARGEHWRSMNLVSYGYGGLVLIRKNVTPEDIDCLLTVLKSTERKFQAFVEKPAGEPLRTQSVWSCDRVAEPDPKWGMQNPVRVSVTEYTWNERKAFLVFYTDAATKEITH